MYKKHHGLGPSVMRGFIYGQLIQRQVQMAQTGAGMVMRNSSGELIFLLHVRFLFDCKNGFGG